MPAPYTPVISGFVGGSVPLPSGDGDYWSPIGWTTPAATAPGGDDTQIQYNNNGAFGGDPAMTFVTTPDPTLTLDCQLWVMNGWVVQLQNNSKIDFYNADNSFKVRLSGPVTLSGDWSIKFPDRNGTICCTDASNGEYLFDDETKGIVRKSPSGHYWRSTMNDDGTETHTDLGTSPP